MEQQQYLIQEEGAEVVSPAENGTLYAPSNEESFPEALVEPPPTSWLEVNTGALERNVRRLQDVVSPAVGIIAVAKSDGYGHGLIPVAETLAASDVNMIGVGSAADAYRLRRAGVQHPLLVLYPVLPAQIPSLVRNQVDITVTNLEAVQTAEQVSRHLKTQARLHMHVETGMHYYGIDPENAPELAQKIHQSPHVKLAGVSTHFAAAESDEPFTQRQHETLLTVLKQLKEVGVYPEMVHVANSAAIDNFPNSYDPSVYHQIFPQAQVLIRAGCLLYGTYRPRNLDLLPEYVASSLVARILEIKKIDRQDTVGYFRSYIADEPRTIAVMPLGWGSNGFLPIDGQAMIQDACVPILGPVSANTCAIDVTGLPVQVGDTVKLFDEAPNSAIRIEDLAAKQGTFVNRLIAMLGASSTRKYIHK